MQPSRAAEEFLRAWARPDKSGLPSADRRARRAARRRLQRRRTLTVAGLLLGVVLGVVVVTGYLLTENVAEKVTRVPDVFGAIDPATRPVEGESLTFLLVGTDSRSTAPTTGTDASTGVDPGSSRSDVLMLARMNPDRTSAAVVSIPRDSWVDIPGHGSNKINAAYAIGGPPLLIETVENLTDIRIDHFAVIDFEGFRSMVDAVGGIDVGIDAPTSHEGVTFRAGINHLDGFEALAYVRQRDGLAGGDLDRAQRQQNALRAVITRIAEQDTLSNPVGTFELLDATSRSVRLDDTLSNGGLRRLASTLNDLEAADITFVHAPVAELEWEGASSVVLLDTDRAAKLWTALQNDRVPLYADAHPADTLGAVTR